MRRSKAEVDRYISSVHSSSPSLKEPYKGFLFAKLYFQAKEYELAKRHVSEYLKVQEWDLKAHTFLGQLYEKEGEVDKAVGCYKRSLDLNPAQKDLVLKVAEFLCSKDPTDSRAEFWVEKASKLLPCNPAVFNLKMDRLRIVSKISTYSTRWRDYISTLAWECLGIPLSELVNVAREREVWGPLLELLPPPPDPG
ncbi:unnamed protein product [Arctogadus glacialis]